MNLLWSRQPRLSPSLLSAQHRVAAAAGIVCLLSAALGHLIARGELAAKDLLIGGMAVLSIPLIVKSTRLAAGAISTLDRWKFILIVLFISSLTFRARSTATIASNPFDAASFVRIGLVAFAALILLVTIVAKRTDPLQAVVRGPLLFWGVFALMSVISTIWSSFPAWTLYRSVEYLVDVLAAGFVAYHLKSLAEVKRIFDWSWLLIATLLLSVLAGIVYAPERAVMRGLGTLGFSIEGVFPAVTRNGVGQSSAVLFLVCLVRSLTYPRGKFMYGLLACYSFALLVIAQTRSALLPVFIAVPVILVLCRRWKLLAAISVIILAVAVPMDGLGAFEDYLRRGQQDQQIATLTGRVDWWESGIAAWKLRPFSGYGAFTAGRFVVGEQFSETLSSSHNMFIEVLVGTSFWGVAPLIGAIGAVWWTLGREALQLRRLGRSDPVRQSLNLEAIGVMIVIMVRSIFSVPIIWHFPLDFLVIAIYASYLWRENRVHDQ